MQSCISKFSCFSVVLVVLALGTTVRAGFDHASAYVQLNGVNDIQSGELYAAAQGSFIGNPLFNEGSQSASATSQGMLGVSGVLVTGSSSSSNPATNVITHAMWQDTLILNGPAGSVLPDYVDLYFHTQGIMTWSGDMGGGSIGVGGGNFVSNYFFGANTDYLDTPGTQWDSVQFGNGVLDGIWHQRVFLGSPDDLGNRSQDWEVQYATSLGVGVGGNSFGTINGNDPPTFSFDAVRLPDGRTPEEAGLSLSFDSGIASPNLQSVPEPSSVVMLGIGTVGLLGSGWLRRKRRGA